MKPLLLLVDLQRDYLSAPLLEPSASAVVRQARLLLDACREAGVPVIHAWTTVSKDDDRRMKHWKRRGRWTCEKDTPGHAPAPGLEPVPGETVVHKSVFSAFSDGSLERLLREREIDRLLIAGVHLHACVRQAALHAYERLGLEIWVAEDATGSDDPVHAAITRRYLEDRTIIFLSTGDVIARLGHPANREPIRESVKAAVDAAAARCTSVKMTWRNTSPASRAGFLERLALRLEAETDGLARMMAAQIGKPLRYGLAEVQRTAQMLRAIAGHATSLEESKSAGSAEIRRRPPGTVGVITPWNNPVYIALGKLAPALVFGNAVLWKPAPEAREVSDQILRLMHEAGLPPEVVGLVHGGRLAAQDVMAHPSVSAVTLTGSSLAGFSAQEICARRRIPLQAELGGNNAALVWHDADLSDAARQIADGAFAMAGQRCTANRRVIVHQDCKVRFIEKLIEETAALAWGDPMNPATRVGPLVSAESCARIAALVEQAQCEAATALFPQGELNPPCAHFQGQWYPPTLLSCDEPAHDIVQHETFGPVLIVQTARDWDEALALLNGVRQGLVAALFSSTPEVIARFLDEAEAGILKINRSTADAEVDVPFGGWKSSGIGPPEHGIFDRDFFTRPQTVYR